MDNSKLILRKILNGQSAMKSELLTRIEKLDKKLSNRIDDLDKKLSGRIDGVEEKLTKRINKLGFQIANLEDDAPTVEEFDELEKRVTKVEQTVASL